MAHWKLLIAMAGFLVLAAGGVFVLVHQEGDVGEIPQEALVAGVEQVVEPEPISKPAPMPKTSPVPTPAKVAPAPTATPTPALEPWPSPVPTPSPTPTETPMSPPQPSSAGPQPPPPPPAPAEKININTASLEELDQITGVGPVIAQRIIDYRNQNGPFQSIEEIKNVSGIGDVNFEKMKDEITVGNVAPAPAPTPSPSPQPEKININTADAATLELLPGVGTAIAKNIIDYRTKHDLFQSIEEIKNVSGIGDVKFEGMKDEITI